MKTQNNPTTTAQRQTATDPDSPAHDLTLDQLNELLNQAAAERERPAHDRAAINRENAQKSTGPRTDSGKARTRFNALRHGLSGRTVLLPSDDLAAYKKFSEEIIASLRPENAIERQLAQTIADTHWRLNRARALEEGLLALGHFENEAAVETDCPQMHTTLTAAAAFRQHNQAFANLTIYEQRLQRMAERTLKQLQDLQTSRKKEFEDTMDEAIPLHRKQEMLEEDWNPAEDGFVYSRAEVEAESDRRIRAHNALVARYHKYDREEYEKAMAA